MSKRAQPPRAVKAKSPSPTPSDDEVEENPPHNEETLDSISNENESHPVPSSTTVGSDILTAAEEENNGDNSMDIVQSTVETGSSSPLATLDELRNQADEEENYKRKYNDFSNLPEEAPRADFRDDWKFEVTLDYTGKLEGIPKSFSRIVDHFAIQNGENELLDQSDYNKFRSNCGKISRVIDEGKRFLTEHPQPITIAPVSSSLSAAIPNQGNVATRKYGDINIPLGAKVTNISVRVLAPNNNQSSLRTAWDKSLSTQVSDAQCTEMYLLLKSMGEGTPDETHRLFGEMLDSKSWNFPTSNRPSVDEIYNRDLNNYWNNKNVSRNGSSSSSNSAPTPMTFHTQSSVHESATPAGHMLPILTDEGIAEWIEEYKEAEESFLKEPLQESVSQIVDTSFQAPGTIIHTVSADFALNVHIYCIIGQMIHNVLCACILRLDRLAHGLNEATVSKLETLKVPCSDNPVVQQHDPRVTDYSNKFTRLVQLCKLIESQFDRGQSLLHMVEKLITCPYGQDYLTRLGELYSSLYLQKQLTWSGNYTRYREITLGGSSLTTLCSMSRLHMCITPEAFTEQHAAVLFIGSVHALFRNKVGQTSMAKAMEELNAITAIREDPSTAVSIVQQLLQAVNDSEKPPAKLLKDAKLINVQTKTTNEQAMAAVTGGNPHKRGAASSKLADKVSKQKQGDKSQVEQAKSEAKAKGWTKALDIVETIAASNKGQPAVVIQTVINRMESVKKLFQRHNDKLKLTNNGLPILRSEFLSWANPHPPNDYSHGATFEDKGALCVLRVLLGDNSTRMHPYFLRYTKDPNWEPTQNFLNVMKDCETKNLKLVDGKP